MFIFVVRMRFVFMADTHDRATRSYNMSRIKSKNTKPELWVRKYLFSQGLRYRINVHSLPGSPDIVLAKYKTVVFINGCFWHGHAGCRYFVIPETRKDWWIEKINKNIERDNRANEALRSVGWNVIIVWECQLKPKQRSKTLADLAAKIRNNL
nr:MAG TPA: DNA G:T-mismatch repair endonuclease [Caudoviricetes sp.]